MRHPQEVIGHIRHIKPIYGWGWISADGATRDAPEPFRLGCDDPNASEGIVLGNHEFSGATASLSSRHTRADGYFNVEIKRDAELIARGYAEA
jgi:hypothetical protein